MAAIHNVDFCFSGWVRNAPVEFVTDTSSMQRVDANKLTRDELLNGLKSGKYVVGFQDMYAEAESSECEISDFKVDDAS